MIDVKFNKEMNSFLKEELNILNLDKAKLEKYLLKTIKENKVRVDSKYKLRSWKLGEGKRIWYTKGLIQCFQWKRTLKNMKDDELMQYEFDENELFFENTVSTKECFQRALKVLAQILYQANKKHIHLIVLLMMVEQEDEKQEIQWTAQIRFYAKRGKQQKEETLWGDINRFGNPTILVCI